MTWFETLTGIREESPDLVRENLTVEGNTLRSLANGKTWTYGALETPSLAELRARVAASKPAAGTLSLREVVANAQDLHADAGNAGALFQVASQFNLLEMISPKITPERGIGIYEKDYTQGPACAIAAGAGTIYRCYFADVNGQTGQSSANQIDCLADLGAALGNTGSRLWEMRNGYTLFSEMGFVEVATRLRLMSEEEIDTLRQKLRIGLQWDTQVTLGNCRHLVTQAYCSALPVGYSQPSTAPWADFARLVLQAAYEATLCAGILNAQRTGNKTVFLTLLGGGAFHNQTDWIVGALRYALARFRQVDLDVAIVSYGSSRHYLQDLIKQTRKPS